MSGESFNLVLPTWQSLSEALGRLRRADSVEQETARQMRRVHDNLRSEIDQVINEQKQRNQQLAHTTRNEMRAIEQSMQQEISLVWSNTKAGLEATYERDVQLTKQITNLSDEMQVGLEQALARDRKLQSSINKVHKEVREGQQRLQSQINTIESRHQNAREAADMWCGETDRILGHIRTNLRHDKFTPGALQRLEQELDIAKSNLRSPGTESAAIAGAQSAYLKAQQLRLQVEALEAEWNARLNAAKGRVLELETEWNANRNPRFQFDTGDGMKVLDGSVDDWTSGKYSELKKLIDEVQKLLASSNNLTLEQIADLEKSLVDLKKDQLRLVSLARQAIVASQLRSDTAILVSEALLQQGWHVVDSTYEGKDHVKLQMGKDEMVITYTPEQTDEAVNNSVNTFFFDRTINDEDSRRSRQSFIVQAIRSAGLECTDMECVPGTENKPCKDMSRLEFDSIRERKKQKQQAVPEGSRPNKKEVQQHRRN
jgi:hypothetical protein